MAETHISEGELHVARQRELVAKLIREGHDDMIPGAKQFLALSEEMQALHLADRDQVRSELAKFELSRKT
jgi:hypothetical protein